MAALHIVGKRIQARYGSKYVWGLYLAGALGGALAMNYFMPYDTINLPKVGADPSISSFFSFLAVQNPRLVAFHLLVPVRMWFLLGFSIFIFLVSDSSQKNLGGLATGAALGLLRRGFFV
jgi:membrane associated rhomboid family serine protease